MHCVLRIPKTTGSPTADFFIGGIGRVEADIFAEDGGARLESTWAGDDAGELRRRLDMIWKLGAGLFFGRDRGLAEELKSLPSIRNRGTGAVEFRVHLDADKVDRMLAILRQSIRKESIHSVNDNEEEGW